MSIDENQPAQPGDQGSTSAGDDPRMVGQTPYEDVPQDLREPGLEQGDSSWKAYGPGAEEQLDRVNQQLQRVSLRVRALMREKPVQTLAALLAGSMFAGYAFGRMKRR